MTESDNKPPRLAGLLLLLLGREAREAISGDLQEEYVAAVRQRGRGPARRLYWRHTLRSLLDRGWGRTRVPVRGYRGSWWRGFGSDLRFGWRMLRTDPGTSLIAIAALGLGIGLSTIGFAIVYGTVLRGLPFERADELVHFERANFDQERLSMAVTPHDFDYWRQYQDSFEGLGAYVESLFLIGSDEGFTERHWGVAISADSFELLRVRPVLGRTFTPEEDAPGGPNVMLIGFGIWQGRFGGDPEIVGQSVRVSGRETTIVGVMPPEFGFPIAERFWRPLQLDLAAFDRGQGRLDVFGRLRPGVSIEQARVDFDRLAAALGSEFPETNAGVVAVQRTFTQEYVGEEFSARVYTMFAAAALVLVMASVNVANLLLARATRRGREIAVRTALGAGRLRIARQLVLETLVLAAFGLASGVLLARAGLHLFETYLAGTTAFALPHGPAAPFWWQYSVDGAALAFSIGVTLCAALIAGLLPAWQVSAANVGDVLRDGSRGSSGGSRSRLGRALVVGEVALCTALLLAAGLVVRSYANLAIVGEGIEADGLVTTTGFLPTTTTFHGSSSPADGGVGYPDLSARLGFWQRAEEVVGGLPDVAQVALASDLPAASNRAVEFATAGTDLGAGETPRARVATITPGFFDVLGVTLLEGRAFESSDDAGGASVAIVNQSFAARYFAGRNPLGEMLRLGAAESAEPWMRVVGVVPDLWMDGVRNRDREGFYLPLAQSESAEPVLRNGRFGLRYMNLIVRPRGEQALAVMALRRAVAGIDRGVPLYGFRGLERHFASRTGSYRLHGSFYLVLGAVALFLAVLGLYGVMAHAVSARTAEIGTRMALGAGRPQILRMVVGQGLRQAAAGAAIGLILAAWLRPQLQRILYGVAPWEPVVTAAILGIMVATAVVASYFPARRAARVEPVEAMRVG